MPVPIAKAKTVCTAAEFGVVEASRRPKLGALSLKEAQRYAERARKLRDKWRDQSRKQARGQQRKAGAADLASRSHLKEQIFADALAGFESQVAKLAPKTAVARSQSAAKKAPPGVQRSTRAATRKQLRGAKVAANAASRKSAATTAKKSSAATPAVQRPSRAPKSVAAQESAAIMAGLKAKLLVSESHPQHPPHDTGSSQQGNLATTAAQQLEAEASVKQSQLAQTGQATRYRGHVTAQGRRAQRRRDVHNA